MALLDSLMALLALSIGLTPMTVLPGQVGRALVENAYRSRMLWQTSNLAESLLQTDSRDGSRLAQQAQQAQQVGECGALSFKLSLERAQAPSAHSLRLQTTGCYMHWQHFDLLVPLP
ncbi:hypothetical protein DFP86_104233 [Paludibacterium purpuratum]|uniref:Uncharacterized protein n=2 Tax=Paludibacterium purpuratum TaxID=1144873 RepID=A0A4R7B874_9NEIS|nr:hypothetical protein DFP86_104233 [Paludibacterium purpuratum]